MNIILYGSKKCQGTRKAERFFRERKIDFQFRDITEKPLTKLEIQNMLQSLGPELLVDTASNIYIKKALSFLESSPLDLLCDYPAIMYTPIIRIDKKYFDGSYPDLLPL